MKLNMNHLRNNKGFSLVELMVVVAIIGILATMSVGQIQKQIAKSRQGEAKTNLASIYTSMKTFNAEFGAYTTSFPASGINFEGNLRYNVGFNGVTVAPPAGYTGTATDLSSAADVCTGANATCTIIATNGITPADGDLVNTAADSVSFTAGAASAIFNAGLDQWTMNQNKVLTNRRDGINTAPVAK